MQDVTILSLQPFIFVKNLYLILYVSKTVCVRFNFTFLKLHTIQLFSTHIEVRVVTLYYLIVNNVCV